MKFKSDIDIESELEPESNVPFIFDNSELVLSNLASLVLLSEDKIDAMSDDVTELLLIIFKILDPLIFAEILSQK